MSIIRWHQLKVDVTHTWSEVLQVAEHVRSTQCFGDFKEYPISPFSGPKDSLYQDFNSRDDVGSHECTMWRRRR